MTHNNQFGLDLPTVGVFDLMSLGGMTVRLDPGEIPWGHARNLELHVSGGEFNVAANLGSCFRMRTAMATAMMNSRIGDRVQHTIDEMCVTGFFKHFEYDGVTGPNFAYTFSDRGWGGRPPKVEYLRSNEGAAKLKPGDFDWDEIFGQGVKWVHSGGIYAALSSTTGPLIIEMFQKAREYGIVTSFDINYRALLWDRQGGQQKAVETCEEIASLTDVLIGNEEDMQLGLGVKGPDVERESKLDPAAFEAIVHSVVSKFPNVKVVATTMRETVNVHHHRWSAVVFANGKCFRAPEADLEVFDRIGGGDGFGAGLIYGIQNNMDPETATKYGWAHGALLTGTPGDTTMVTKRMVEDYVSGESARVKR